jgi:PAS domain S-box-containing protein
MSGVTGELSAEADREQGMNASEAARHDLRSSVTVDRDGIIRQWGDGVTEVVGYSAADTVGQSLNVVIPPALRPLHWRGFDQAMKTGRLDRQLFKIPAVCKDGRIVVAHATIELISGDGGGTDGGLVTFVGVGAPWQGRAWQAALAPIDLAHRMWRRARSKR